MFDPQLNRWLSALLTRADFFSPDLVNDLAEGAATAEVSN